MSELSPAAQAVLDAYDNSPFDEDYGDRVAIAAALRAAVACSQQYKGKDCLFNEVWECDADELLAIAEELENNV